MVIPQFPIMRVKASGLPAGVSWPRSVKFDDTLGDFPVDGAGNTLTATAIETVEDWALGALMTDRGVSPCYRRDFGAEWRRAPRLGSRAIVEATARRWIREALMIDRRIVGVEGYAFTWAGADLTIEFSIVLHEGGKIGMEVSVSG